MSTSNHNDHGNNSNSNPSHSRRNRAPQARKERAASAAMAQQKTVTPANAPAAPKLNGLNLPTDPRLLSQTTLPPLNAMHICKDHVGILDDLPSLDDLYKNGKNPTPGAGAGAAGPNANNVLLIVPTANQSKTTLLVSHLQASKAAHVAAVTHRQIPAESGVGEQPYDGAGPRGALARAVNAARELAASADHRDELVRDRVGTVVVAAVENFIARERLRRADGGELVLPVDYGVVVFCRVSLVEGTGAGKWEWRAGVSRGVTVPVGYWRAAEREGFDDGDGRLFGKKTVGELLHEEAGLDKADWHKQLAGVSRYDLLREAMVEMTKTAPWPEFAKATGASTASAGAASK